MTSPPPSSAGDTSSADHLLGLISAQIRPPRRVNTWSTDCTPSRPARVSQVGKVGLEVMPITTVTLSKGNGFAYHRKQKALARSAIRVALRRIPPDPFTGRNETWRIEKSGDSFDVHSGSDAVSSEGTRYSSW